MTSRLRRTVFDRSKEKRHFLCNTFKSSDFLIDRSSSSLHSATGLPHSIAFVPTLSLANAKELHIIRWLRSSWLPWCPEIYSSEDVSHFGEQKLLLARGQVSNWKGVCRYATLGMARDVVLKEPLSLHQKCGFKHGIRSNNLSSACKSNSFFTPPPPFRHEFFVDHILYINKSSRTHWSSTFSRGNFGLGDDEISLYALKFCFRIVLKHPVLFSSNFAIEKV